MALYREALAEDNRVRLVMEPAGIRPAWHLFIVQVPNRRRVFEALQQHYRERYGTTRGMLPETEKYYDGAISLPLFPSMKDADVEREVGEVRKALE